MLFDLFQQLQVSFISKILKKKINSRRDFSISTLWIVKCGNMIHSKKKDSLSSESKELGRKRLDFFKLRVAGM